MKRCSKCRVVKSDAGFGRKDGGLRARCKACTNEDSAAHAARAAKQAQRDAAVARTISAAQHRARIPRLSDEQRADIGQRRAARESWESIATQMGMTAVDLRLAVGGIDSHGERICADCKKVLPITRFAAAPGLSRGRAPICRGCARVWAGSGGLRPRGDGGDRRYEERQLTTESRGQ